MSRLETIADPKRLAVARHLAAHPRASAPEVAASVGVHLNTARAHLAALREIGLVERTSESTGRRGRPVVRYSLSADWAPAGDELLPLSSLMASAITRARRDPAALREAASEWGRRWAGESGSRPAEETLTAALSRL